MPLSPTRHGGDLAVALGLPVVMVVGLRLGCLNHALLTRDAIAARGLTLAGWIVNRLDPAMPEQDANLAYLRAQLGAPLLADWPWQPDAAPESLRFDATAPSTGLPGPPSWLICTRCSTPSWPSSTRSSCAASAAWSRRPRLAMRPVP